MKTERFITVEENIDLWVETYGNSDKEACLFISGAGANSSFWSDRLCNRLVEDGFFVVKYDHRDFGYSSKIDWDTNPYNFMQLVDDAITILDSLENKKAHLVGHSMGGFIAQLIAIHYPERVLSMVSASSSTNSPEVPEPPDKTWKVFMSMKPANNYKKDLDGFLKVWKYLNGTALFDEELAVEYTRNLYKRQSVNGPLGDTHVKAQETLTDRSELLKNIAIPTLVIHGEDDWLVDKYGGIQTANCIQGAELALIPEMGHVPFNQRIIERFENEITGFLNKHKIK